ncbi:MAG: peptidoglycan-binding protein [Rhodomicrobium sp.]|nr:peptidoglycan-binding protein [Rhodomicrobium sp.]
MRRFSLVLILAALTAYFILPSHQDRPNPQGHGAQTTADGLQDAVSSSGVGDAKASPQASVDTPAKTQPAALDVAAAQPEETISADSETVAPAHIQSSIDANAIDPLLASLSDADLITTAQKQLAKLGCYKAGVDGIWGRKSRAAIREFNRRTGGNWDDDPSRSLIAALRKAPAGLCELPCADGGSAGQCKVVSAPKNGKRKQRETIDSQAYLPPWMRGDQTASLATEETASDAAANTASPEPAISRDRAAPRRAERRASEARHRTAEQRRPANRNDNWNLVNWPGTAN